MGWVKTDGQFLKAGSPTLEVTTFTFSFALVNSALSETDGKGPALENGSLGVAKMSCIMFPSRFRPRAAGQRRERCKGGNLFIIRKI